MRIECAARGWAAGTSARHDMPPTIPGQSVSLEDARFFSEKIQTICRGPQQGHDLNVIRRHFVSSCTVGKRSFILFAMPRGLATTKRGCLGASDGRQFLGSDASAADGPVAHDFEPRYAPGTIDQQRGRCRALPSCVRRASQCLAKDGTRAGYKPGLKSSGNWCDSCDLQLATSG